MSEELICRPRKFYKFIFLSLAIMCLIGLVTYLFIDIPVSNFYYVFIILMVIGIISYIWLFIYDIKRQIIVSPKSIENIRAFSPFFSMNRALRRIFWKDIKILKLYKTPFVQEYFVITERGNFIHFVLPYMENGKELAEYIEKKTGKKFE